MGPISIKKTLQLFTSRHNNHALTVFYFGGRLKIVMMLIRKQERTKRKQRENLQSQ